MCLILNVLVKYQQSFSGSNCTKVKSYKIKQKFYILLYVSVYLQINLEESKVQYLYFHSATFGGRVARNGNTQVKYKYLKFILLYLLHFMTYLIL